MPLPKNLNESNMKKSPGSRMLANRYGVQSKLGTGNYGTAWLVFDHQARTKKDEKKVVKEMSIGALEPDETVDAQREADLLNSLNHPSIVKFFNSFMIHTSFYIVTEFCDGGDLDQKIQSCRKEDTRIPEPLVLEWLIQILLAVQYMHKRRVLHRDLKTRNIFLRNNMVKIGDFGISRVLMSATDMASTFTGTPFYMSPEVLRHEGYNSKSDVWSVGVILYEMVSLHHAFDGKTLMDVMYKIVEGDLPEWPKEYSTHLEEIFQSLLIKDPEDRPSASEALKIPFIHSQLQLITQTLKTKHNSKESEESIQKDSKKLHKAMSRKVYPSSIPELECEETMKPKKSTPSHDGRSEYREYGEHGEHGEQRIDGMTEQKRDGQDPRARNHVWASEKTVQRRKLNDQCTSRSRTADKPNDLTPTERMRQRKKEKADAEATKVAQMLKTQFHQTQENYHRIRSGQNAYNSQAPPWETQEHENEEMGLKPRPFTAPAQGQKLLEEDDLYDTGPLTHSLPMTIDDNDIRHSINLPMRDPHRQFQDEDSDNDDCYDDNEREEALNIPEDPAMAETYYSQFDSEFDSDSDESDDRTFQATGRKTKHLPSPVQRRVSFDEEEDLLNCMENALGASLNNNNQTLVDDATCGAFGPIARDRKIKALTVECIGMMSKPLFEKAYYIMKNARYGGETIAEEVWMKKIKENIPEITSNDCFMIDHLLFLEEQAK